MSVGCIGFAIEACGECGHALFVHKEGRCEWAIVNPGLNPQDPIPWRTPPCRCTGGGASPSA